MHSERPCDAVLEVGHEDRVDVWLNRRRVGRFDRQRPQDWGTVDVPLRLEAGANDVVLWQTNDRRENWTAWAASLRLRAPGGGPLTGVHALPERFASLPPTLERWREPAPDRASIGDAPTGAPTGSEAHGGAPSFL